MYWVLTDQTLSSFVSQDFGKSCEVWTAALNELFQNIISMSEAVVPVITAYTDIKNGY